MTRHVIERISSYTLGNEYSEKEFLSREIGLDITTISSDELIRIVRGTHKLNQRTVVVGEGSQLESVLRSVPPDSIILIQISDESCFPRRHFLAGHPAIHWTFRHYSTRPASIVDVFFSALGYLRDNYWSFRSLRQLSGALVELFKYQSRARKIRTQNRNRTTILPLGYTNKFADEFAQKFSITRGESLLSWACREPSTHPLRPQLVGFVGAPGRLQRSALLRVLDKTSEHSLTAAIHSPRWLGHTNELPTAADYIDVLLQVQFGACPPGQIANESFRTMESAICGAMPVSLRVSLTQGTRDPFDWFGKRFWSWRSAVASMKQDKFSSEELHSLLLRMKEFLDSVNLELTVQRG